MTLAFVSSTLHPYASNQSAGLNALKNQRELVLNEAGECDLRGWVVYDSDRSPPTSKTKKHPSLCVFAESGNAKGIINGSDTIANTTQPIPPVPTAWNGNFRSNGL